MKTFTHLLTRASKCHEEYRYKYYRGDCRYMLEVDPGTRKIVDARFEGEELDCIIVP